MDQELLNLATFVTEVDRQAIIVPFVVSSSSFSKQNAKNYFDTHKEILSLTKHEQNLIIPRLSSSIHLSTEVAYEN
jgi:hypothetical protein